MGVTLHPGRARCAAASACPRRRGLAHQLNHAQPHQRTHLRWLEPTENQVPDVDMRLGGTHGAFEGSRKLAELGVWQSCLNCGKQPSLLVANVLL
jgi:hypothetical protein